MIELLLNYLTILFKVLFFIDIASLNKTELDFNLTLCNVFIFCSLLLSIKNRNKQKKNEKGSINAIAEELLKSLIHGEIEVKFRWRWKQLR